MHRYFRLVCNVLIIVLHELLDYSSFLEFYGKAVQLSRKDYMSLNKDMKNIEVNSPARVCNILRKYEEPYFVEKSKCLSN